MYCLQIPWETSDENSMIQTIISGGYAVVVPDIFLMTFFLNCNKICTRFFFKYSKICKNLVIFHDFFCSFLEHMETNYPITPSAQVGFYLASSKLHKIIFSAPCLPDVYLWFNCYYHMNMLFIRYIIWLTHNTDQVHTVRRLHKTISVIW